MGLDFIVEDGNFDTVLNEVRKQDTTNSLIMSKDVVLVEHITKELIELVNDEDITCFNIDKYDNIQDFDKVKKVFVESNFIALSNAITMLIYNIPELSEAQETDELKVNSEGEIIMNNTEDKNYVIKLNDKAYYKKESKPNHSDYYNPFQVEHKITNDISDATVFTELEQAKKIVEKFGGDIYEEVWKQV